MKQEPKTYRLSGKELANEYPEESQDLPAAARTVLALLAGDVNAELEDYKEVPGRGMSIQSALASLATGNMAHSNILVLILVVSCLAAAVLSFPADSPVGPGKRIPKGVAPPGGKDLEGAESYGYGWGGYGGWGWGGYGGWGGWGYPGYGYGYGYYGYPYGGYYGGYGPYWGGYWW